MEYGLLYDLRAIGVGVAGHKVIFSGGMAKQSSRDMDTKAASLLHPTVVSPKSHTVGSRGFCLVCEMPGHMLEDMFPFQSVWTGHEERWVPHHS